jgi:hypothetical protein
MRPAKLTSYRQSERMSQRSSRSIVPPRHEARDTFIMPPSRAMISSEGIRVFSARISWGSGTLSLSLGRGNTTTPRQTQENFVIIALKTHTSRWNRLRNLLRNTRLPGTFRSLRGEALSSSDANELEPNKFIAHFGFPPAAPFPTSEAFSTMLSPEDFTENFLPHPKGLADVSSWAEV